MGLLKDPERPPDSPLGRQIWVTSVDGGKGELAYELPRPQRLRNPTWSPDGKWLAFLVCPRTDYATQMMLVQIRPDGRPAGTPVTVDLPRTSSEYLPGWGADNKIGLVIRTPETTALYTVPASGGKAAQLTPKEGWMPSWTPDGKRIYFAGSNLEVRASVEFIPASGGTVTRIPLKASQRVQIAYPSGGTSVSPDGKTVLFCGAYMPMSKNEGMRLFVVPVDGGEVTEFRTGMPWVYQPCWSPDGKSIAFVRSEEVPKTNKWVNSICTMPVSGGKPRQISSQTDNVLDGRLAWSPNGKHIAYYSEDDKLKLSPVDGGSSRILLEGLKGYRRDSGLAWSPDGKQLAYITQDRIWKLNLETGKSEEVQTGLDAHHMQLAWSPDGASIAFSALQGGEPELWLMSDFLPR